MKKLFYMFIASTMLTGCNNNEILDNTKATTSAYFSTQPKIKYERQKEIIDENVKNSYTEFETINNSTIDIELDGVVETVSVSKFNPKVYTDSEGNKNQFYIDYDKEKISQFAKEINKKYSVKAIEPTVNVVNGTLEFTEGANGKKFNEEKFCENLYIALKNREKYVKIESDTKTPKCNIEDLRQISGSLGTFSTKLGESTENRIKNLTVASNSINNVIVMPNETFSMNEVLGDISYDKGYVDAPVIINGVTTKDIAGGVCQISSTLYNAVLNAELTIVERKNHSSMVKYVPAGLDATLVNGVIDFKFKNNTDVPVVIVSSVANGNVTVSIYGKDERPENRKIKFWSEKVEVIEETGYDISLDDTKDPNYKETVFEPKNGYVYEVYKTVFVDDVKVSTELVNKSKYKPRKGKIVVGKEAYKTYSD